MNDEPILESGRAWNMTTIAITVLSATVVMVGFLTVYSLIRVDGVEDSNRDIICQSRELREKNPPETAYERAALENARQNPADCD